MKNNLISKIHSVIMLITVVAVGGITRSQEQPPQETEVKAAQNTKSDGDVRHIVPLIDNPPDTVKTILSNLKVRMEADEVQDSNQGGIKLSLFLVNEGNKKIDILNPLDFIHLILFDEKGNIVRLPEVAPRFLINTRGKVQFPYKISVFLNDHQLTEQEISQRSFSLLTNQQLRVNIEINQVLKQHEGDKKAETRKPQKIISIPAGNYQIGILVKIVHADSKASRDLESKFVTITLEDIKSKDQETEKG